MNKNISLIISQFFLPAGGGLENTMNRVAHAVAKSPVVNEVEVLCISQDKSKEEIFDAQFDLGIYRAHHDALYKLIEANYKNFNSLVSGSKKLTIKGRMSMLLVAALSILALGYLLRSRIKAHKGDRVVIHCFSMATLALGYFFKKVYFRRNIKLVFSNGFVYQSSGFKLADYVMGKALANTDQIVCATEVGKKRLQDSYRLERPIEVCANWIDLAALPIAKYARINKVKVVKVLSVGRVVPEKGIQEIIDLSEYLANKKAAKYRITVIGDSAHPIKHELTACAEKSKVLEYLGRINKPKLWQFYLDSNIFLMPVQWDEGFGNVLLEAFNFGLLVVASNKGGIPSVCKPFKNSFVLIDDFSPAQMEKALEKVIKQQPEPKDKRAVTNRKIIEEFYSAKNAEKYLAIYRKLFT